MKRRLCICLMMFLLLCLTMPMTALAAKAGKQSGQWKKDNKGIWYVSVSAIRHCLFLAPLK